jgi:WD40 repeat protein
LAIADYRSEIQLWRVSDGRLIQRLTGHTNRLAGPLRFSPDSRRLAANYPDGVEAMWDLEHPQNRAIWRAHEMIVVGCAFSPDGGWLATGSADGLVRIWETSTLRLVASLPISVMDVLSVAFSPDGRRLAAGSSDGSVTLFDLATFQPIARFHEHIQPALYNLAFSPDGSALISMSLKEIVVRRAPSGF